MNDLRLILPIGIPGSGKTTWLRKQFLSNKVIDHIAIVSPDRIRQELFSDISSQENNTEVWYIAKERTVSYLMKGTSVILDATNVGTSNRVKFISGLPKCGLMAKLLPAEPEICWERIQKDLEDKVNRSAVPKEVIYRMYGDYLYTIQVIESEGFKLIEDI